jgi:single-stranded DNA-specific DHH superfamily exonuclease
LQRYLGRGKGVPIKSFPDFDANYFRRVDELKADYIFILDKPVVSRGFWEKAEQRNIPIVWVDHHEIQDKELGIPEFVDYFNPMYDDKMKQMHDYVEPVTVMCYQVTQKKEDLWLAVIGAISDKFMPDYYPEFEKKYPDLSTNVKNPGAFDVFYKSEIGKIAKMMAAGLKDRTSNVISMLRFLMSVKTPYEVLEESSKNYLMRKRFNQINEKYQRLLTKAIEAENASKDSNILFFQYGGDLSVSAELSNELSYLFPKKNIVVIMIKSEVKASISARGENIREVILKAFEGLEDAQGGGHEKAVGGQLRVEDLEKFKLNVCRLLKE